MNILLNFIPLKMGGGVQVGLDFISNIGNLGKEHRWFLICTEATPFQQVVLPENCYRVKIISRSLIGRLFFEYVLASGLVRKYEIDAVYTQFGPPLLNVNVKNIIGCAYSNLFYPEVDFWDGNTTLKKVERYIFDFARLWSLRRSDIVVFETKDLSDRAVRQKILKDGQSTYVLPAVSSTLKSRRVKGAFSEKIEKHNSRFRLCIISSYGRHKNFEKLVDVLYVIREKYRRSDISFVLTLPNENKHVCNLFETARKKGVENSLLNIGPIPYDSCAEVYLSSDAAILLSTLESFSNNIAEAWATSRPLVVSDLDWARSICADAALYVDIDNPERIADSLVELVEDRKLRDDLVGRGRERSRSFPSSSQRFSQYLKIIEGVAE